MHVLSIDDNALRHLRAHAEEAYPHECCGVLLGNPSSAGWQVAAAVRATNTQTGAPHNRYAIAPAELVSLQRDAAHRGLEIAGFYHSHPDHPAHWSQIDLDEAHWIGCCYVITAVAQGKLEQTQAFLLAGTREEDKRFVPMRIEIVASASVPLVR